MPIKKPHAPRALSAKQREKIKAAGDNLWLEYTQCRDALRKLKVPARQANELVMRHHSAIAAVLLGNKVPEVMLWPTAKQIHADFWRGSDAEAKARAEKKTNPRKAARKEEGMGLSGAAQSKSKHHGNDENYLYNGDEFEHAIADRAVESDWVETNLRFSVTQNEAPSQRAWGMLLWARDNETKFRETYVKSFGSSKKKKEEEEKLGDEIKLIEEYINAYNEVDR